MKVYAVELCGKPPRRHGYGEAIVAAHTPKDARALAQELLIEEKIPMVTRKVEEMHVLNFSGHFPVVLRLAYNVE